MIDLQKLLAECEFHIKRGDAMVMPPALIKALAEELQQARSGEAVCILAIGVNEYGNPTRQFELLDVNFQGSAKLFTHSQPAPDFQELIEALSILSRWVDQNCEDPACTLPLKQAKEALAKHGGV